jgi:hypothetical protein
MPTPATTDLPRPKSWDEFEDICADILKRMWCDPYVTRNGRSGQSQNGVDSYGYPEHLGGHASGKVAAAQCKRTDALTIDTVMGEVEAAKDFKPELSEYLILTTAPRDAKLQENVRTGTWPFRVHVLFWEDISLSLSAHEDLLQKHFPGWVQRSTSKEQVFERLMAAEPDDFDYNDSTGVYVHRSDIYLRLELARSSEEDKEFAEPWVERFPDKRASVQVVHIVYATTRLTEIYCAWVDGTRYLIPYPKTPDELVLSPFKYHLGRILNHPFPEYDFDCALRNARIEVKAG